MARPESHNCKETELVLLAWSTGLLALTGSSYVSVWIVRSPGCSDKATNAGQSGGSALLSNIGILAEMPFSNLHPNLVKGIKWKQKENMCNFLIAKKIFQNGISLMMFWAIFSVERRLSMYWIIWHSPAGLLQLGEGQAILGSFSLYKLPSYVIRRRGLL